MITSRKNIILIGYFFTATILLLDCTDNFPGTSLGRKLKYVYLAMLIAEFIFSRVKTISKKSVLVIGALLIHTILFGIVYVNPSVQKLTRIHFQEMLIYLLLLGFLTNIVERYHCKFEFIKATCAACTIFLLWCGITHFRNFVNPAYYIYVFNRSARIRGEFGTGSPNYMGYYCFISLIFFYALWREYGRNDQLTQKKKYYLLSISGWTILILFSTGSRSSILSFLIFGSICVYQIKLKQYLGKSRYFFIMALMVISTIFLFYNWSGIWADANREANISINIPVFNQMNAFWKGMGYIESSGFYNDVYGYDTWPVDIYYLYIYLSTGVIGSVIIAIPLIYIFLELLISRDNFIKTVMWPAYIAILFDGLWQVNIFTYRYIATLFIGVLLLTSISLQQKNNLIGMYYYEETK